MGSQFPARPTTTCSPSDPEADVFVDLISGDSRLEWSLYDSAGQALFEDQPTQYAVIENYRLHLGPDTYTVVLTPQLAELPAYSFAVYTLLDTSAVVALDTAEQALIGTPGASPHFHLRRCRR